MQQRSTKQFNERYRNNTQGAKTRNANVTVRPSKRGPALSRTIWQAPKRRTTISIVPISKSKEPDPPNTSLHLAHSRRNPLRIPLETSSIRRSRRQSSRVNAGGPIERNKSCHEPCEGMLWANTIQRNDQFRIPSEKAKEIFSRPNPRSVLSLFIFFYMSPALSSCLRRRLTEPHEVPSGKHGEGRATFPVEGLVGSLATVSEEFR